MKQAGRYDWMWVLLLSAAVVFLSFPALMLHPNSSLFTIGGDGIKNYFTALFYLQYNSGVHMNGMNYPYGEHLSFADAQPGLMVPFHWLSSVFPQLKGYSVAFFNYAVLAGPVLGSISIYLLLKEYQANRLMSIVGALAITFLSPQVFRMESHYGLSYLFAVPLGWYLFLKAERTLHMGWAVAAVLCISWTGLLHFYLAAITCLFLLGYTFFSTLFAWKKSTAKEQLIRWGIPVISLLLLQVFMKLTDSVADRPSKPWGFFTALADWETVFRPHASDFLVQAALEPGILNEGFAYIGCVPILFLLALILFYLTHLILKKQSAFLTPLSNADVRFLVSASCLLLFSMGIPFIWNLEWLTDKISFLKQFRGLGRFAWAFYYCSSVFAVVALSRWYNLIQTAKLKKLFAGFITLCLLAWITEAGWRMKTVHHWNGHAQRNYLLFMGNNYQTLLKGSGVFPNRYQAILSLPYHHIGSEKFALDQWPSPYYAMKAALQTGIPSLNVMLSRTSLSQSCLQMQLTGDTLLKKELLSSLHPQQPLLLITSKNSVLSASEQSLVNQSRFLATDGEVTFYETPVSAFEQRTAVVKEQFRNRGQQLHLQPGYYTSAPAEVAILKYFDSTRNLADWAMINRSTSKRPLLLDTILYNHNAGDTLSVSLWLEIEPEKDELPVLLLSERYKGKEVGSAQFPSKVSRDVVGRRIRVSGDYIVQQPGSRLIVSLHTGSLYSNLLIRKKGVNVFAVAGKNEFLFNNLPVKWN